MCVNINDPNVLDSQVIELPEMCEIIGVRRNALRNAIERFRIPEPMDAQGTNGAMRWTVGMLRQWHLFLGEEQLEKSKAKFRKFTHDEGIEERRPMPRVNRSALIERAAQMGIDHI